MKKPAAVSTIVRILDRYDLVFIMEIRDSENAAIYDLLQRLNHQSSRNYQIIVSERLGRTTSKEQYAFLYNPDRVMPDQSYVYPDNQDRFEREPFVARFRFGLDSFTMIGLHSTPSDVKGELNELPAVYDDAKQKLGSRNIFIVGDLNADCSYYNPRHGFDFFGDAVTPLVPEGTDTTVGPSSCTYDRVLAFGQLPRSSSIARPFNFQEAYGLNLADAAQVSDHYPVEWTLASENSDEDSNVPPLPSKAETPTAGFCGLAPTPTPRGYCYAEFPNGRRKRVANACCPH